MGVELITMKGVRDVVYP